MSYWFETNPSSGQLVYYTLCLYFSLSVFRLLPFRQFLLYVLQTAGTDDNNEEAIHYERGCLVSSLSTYFRNGCWKSEPHKGSTEEITSALTFFSSDAALVIASNQNVTKSGNVCSVFEKRVGLNPRSEASYGAMSCERRLLLSRCWTPISTDP